MYHHKALYYKVVTMWKIAYGKISYNPLYYELKTENKFNESRMIKFPEKMKR